MIFLNPDTPNLPRLPEIQGSGDLRGNLLMVAYTHSSCLPPDAADNAAYGTPDRLTEIGLHALRMAATQYYFFYRPMLSAEDIRTRVHYVTTGAKVHEWLLAYKLKNRYTASPEADPNSILVNDIEMQSFFYTHIGVLCYCNGLQVVMKWFSDLLGLSHGYAIKTEDVDVSMSDTSPPYEPHPPQSPPPPRPGSPRSPGFGSDGASTSSPNILNLISVAYVNEMASKKKVSIDYHSAKEGQDHNPAWTVSCVINGNVKGRGTSSKAKTAKEIAARNAFVAMGWHAT